MRRTLLTLACLTVVLAFTLPAQAVNWHFPVTENIPAGMTWHFGTLYVSSVSTAMHIQAWFINNWVNYTVDSLGTQQIFNDTLQAQSIVPAVWIDGTSAAQNVGWTYTAGLTTVTAAHSSVAIQFGVTSSGPGGPGGPGPSPSPSPQPSPSPTQNPNPSPSPNPNQNPVLPSIDYGLVALIAIIILIVLAVTSTSQHRSLKRTSGAWKKKVQNGKNRHVPWKRKKQKQVKWSKGKKEWA